MKLDSPFDFSMGTVPEGALRVVSFRGRERLSKPYAFDLVIATEDVDEASFPKDNVGQSARLLIHGPAGSRAVRGVVSRIASASTQSNRWTAWKLRLVPRLGLLKHRRNSRIFQDRTTPEIVSAILDEAGVPHRWDTQQKYAPRTYCVQYEETDFDFVQRLLAEVFVFYRFEHAGSEAAADVDALLVLGDRAHYPLIDGDCRLVHRQAQPGFALKLEEHHVTTFDRRLSLAPTAYARRDYDFQRPLAEIGANALAEDTATRAVRSPGEVYEHHAEYAEPESEHRLETAALEQLRRKVDVSGGESHCPRLLVGRRFTLAEHEMGSHDGDYVVTAVEHEGKAPEIIEDGGPSYHNHFGCILAARMSRPARRARQLRQVMETAVVTGPERQEIYTDAYGRIKVQFHWDREGKRNEHSSCFMRVAQAWSGTGWGFQFIPRIGMEVLVSFLGGDPDRPMVVGCVPNATHPVPYPLTENQAQSGIKTESTPGGGGFNELLFNDTRGSELVSIRAERNFSETVLSDHLQSIGRDQTVAVAGKRTTEVKGEDRLTVEGGQSWTVCGASSVSVSGGASAVYAGTRSTAIVGDDTTRIGGGQTVMAAAYSHLLIGHGAPEGHGLVNVNGDYRISAAASVRVGAANSLILSCGESSIELLPGEIRLKSPKLTLLAADELHARGNEHELALTDHAEIRGKDIRLFGKEAQLLLNEDAKLSGKLVKLNGDRPKPESKDTEDQDEKGTITFRVKPHFPIQAGEQLIAVIAMPTGETVESAVDANMEVLLEGKKGDRFTLIELRKGELPVGSRGG